MNWIFNLFERHGDDPELHEKLLEDFEHRLCSNRKVVTQCLFDGRRINGMLRRFPCSACPKNKRNKRWADYRAKDLIIIEKKNIVKAQALVCQDELKKERKRQEGFWRKINQVRSNPTFASIRKISEH